MAFALEHAEAAAQVADIIIGSLLVESTAVPRKVARLHLICDILHNSAASIPNAWKFRQEFQSRLPLVFEHMSVIYHSFPGRITAETFKKQILAVVEVWEDWIVFPPEFTSELRAKLDGITPEDPRQKEMEETKSHEVATSFASKFKASTFKPAEDPSGTQPVEQSTAVNPANPQEEDDDIDGMAIDDIDGEPVDDIDGQSIDDIDGEPMDDIDGAPI
jgi:U2-associated protein SR140